jgi:NTE family protein
MSTQTPTILILQGGGALGAYECGAYQVLASRLEHLAVVAGTSIGAINAGLIARHYRDRDRGKAALKRFWTQVLPIPAPPACPVFEVPGLDRWRREMAVWTGVWWGNAHLFTPASWNPFAPSHYDTQAMERTVAHHVGTYGPSAEPPRLIVTAVDVQAGTIRAFDSRCEGITPEMVVASGSLPPNFPAREIEGKFYWDGGLWSNTPLREVLNAMQRKPTEGEPEAQAEAPFQTYRVYLVDVFPQQGALPHTALQVLSRMADLTFADKTDYDAKMAERFNQYIRLVENLHGQVGQLRPALNAQGEEVERAYEQLKAEKRMLLEVVRLKRSALPYDEVSGAGDYSRERIDELIAQGERETAQQLAAHESGQAAGSA